MYSLDHPNEFRFERPGKIDPRIKDITAKAAWSDVLVGDALKNYLRGKIPNEETLKILRATSTTGAVVQMGTRDDSK